MVAPTSIDPEVLKHLHLEVLPLATQKAFLVCISLPLFSFGNWYLAGGTALALQVGHRQSVDLDFFTSNKTFDEKRLAEILSESGKWETTSISRGTLYGKFLNAKVSFISYPFFTPTKPFLQAGTISIITPPNVAAMKIVAISQRGKKRDFIDLYWISQKVQPLWESIQQAEQQYSVSQNPNHLLKSLTYFEDAENDPMPDLFFKTSWAEIKKYFQHEVPIIARKIIGLD